jgi:hypothetical protein
MFVPYTVKIANAGLQTGQREGGGDAEPEILEGWNFPTPATLYSAPPMSPSEFDKLFNSVWGCMDPLGTGYIAG